MYELGQTHRISHWTH